MSLVGKKRKVTKGLKGIKKEIKGEWIGVKKISQKKLENGTRRSEKRIDL